MIKKDIVLFDGTCKLCNNAVRFIARHDRKSRFCFIPLDSDKAVDILRQYNGGIIDRGTMLLITRDRAFRKTDAVLRILSHLNGMWPVFYIFLAVPRFIRNPVYDLISKYRYRFFGPCVDCPEPTPCN